VGRQRRRGTISAAGLRLHYGMAGRHPAADRRELAPALGPAFLSGEYLFRLARPAGREGTDRVRSRGHAGGAVHVFRQHKVWERRRGHGASISDAHHHRRLYGAFRPEAAEARRAALCRDGRHGDVPPGHPLRLWEALDSRRRRGMGTAVGGFRRFLYRAAEAHDPQMEGDARHRLGHACRRDRPFRGLSAVAFLGPLGRYGGADLRVYHRLRHGGGLRLLPWQPEIHPPDGSEHSGLRRAADRHPAFRFVAAHSVRADGRVGLRFDLVHGVPAGSGKRGKIGGRVFAG